MCVKLINVIAIVLQMLNGDKVHLNGEFTKKRKTKQSLVLVLRSNKNQNLIFFLPEIEIKCGTCCNNA